MTSGCNKVDAVRLQVEFTFSRELEVRASAILMFLCAAHRNLRKKWYITLILILGLFTYLDLGKVRASTCRNAAFTKVRPVHAAFY